MDLWNNRKWTPMLLSEVNKPFDDENYLFEIKFDGIRAVIFVSPTDIEIKSRNGKDMTSLFPELKNICKLVKKKTILDGEIVLMDDSKPNFSKLQARIHLKDISKINRKSVNDPVTYICFDILYREKNLTDMPLIKRKKLLNEINNADIFVKSKIIDKNGIKLFDKVKSLSLEGIVAKEKMGIYNINKRDKTWIKIKNFKEGVFIVGGYEIKREHRISLALGEFENNELRYVGNSTIMDNSSLYNKILKISKVKASFIDYKNSSTVFIKPILKVQISYLERTKNNHLRHPVVKDD